MDLNKRHFVSDNWIHHCGRLVGHGAGIFVWASGNNDITHNRIHDMPRYGVCIKGQKYGKLKRSTLDVEVEVAFKRKR